MHVLIYIYTFFSQTRPDLRALQIVIYKSTDLIVISHLVSHLTDYLVHHIVSFKTNSVCVKGLFIYLWDVQNVLI